MKIKFDSTQTFQREAIEAVVDVFDGQPLAATPHEVRLDAARGDLFSELGIANSLLLDDRRILENVREVQAGNDLPQSDALDGLHFSIEMETGTGKTYVYLRTIYELRLRYGFKKFVIVVPSVAIREGVLKNIELTSDHFTDLYGNLPVDSWIYDSAAVSRLRHFAAADQLQILILNIDAFNKPDIAVIHRENDRLSGRRPIEFIQATRPIVVIDEPQNMETETARAAIASLSPLCTLRYSATHRNLYNLLYRLDPVRAYELGLVKRIEVDGVSESGDYNRPFVQVEKVYASKRRLAAKVRIDVRQKEKIARKTVTVKEGDDLREKSKGRTQYEGYVVSDMDAVEGRLVFANGIALRVGRSQGQYGDEIMRVQVEETVRAHFEKELRCAELVPQPIKVLSLFFIDRVANYVTAEGKIRRWFIEAYTAQASDAKFKKLKLPLVEGVHNGYFAVSRGEARDTNGATKADDEAYGLIMRDKERLLSVDEPLRFIFSHSALREGWDNPNVFQICTLNETRSEMRKRQEIGRGLRLPVMADGDRCHDPQVNLLTVVANESYEDFARQLQQEIEEECGVEFGSERIANRRERQPIRLKEGWRRNPHFKELWKRIQHRTRYTVEYETEELVRTAAAAIRKMPKVERPNLKVARAQLELGRQGIEATPRAVRRTSRRKASFPIPDLIGHLQRETELTRASLARILVESGRLQDAAVNPQQFLDLALSCIQDVLQKLLVQGIRYERIAGSTYEMRRLEDDEISSYVSRMTKVKRSIYDAVEFDSQVERRFAEALDGRDDIRLFFKLPSWFMVETPVGRYRPDWAIVKQPEGEEARLYLVRETKGTTDPGKLRESEWARIECGKAHFKVLDVDFDYVTSADAV